MPAEAKTHSFMNFLMHLINIHNRCLFHAQKQVTDAVAAEESQSFHARVAPSISPDAVLFLLFPRYRWPEQRATEGQNSLWQSNPRLIEKLLYVSLS